MTIANEIAGLFAVAATCWIEYFSGAVWPSDPGATPFHNGTASGSGGVPLAQPHKSATHPNVISRLHMFIGRNIIRSSHCWRNSTSLATRQVGGFTLGIATRISISLIAAVALSSCAHQTASIQPINPLPPTNPVPSDGPDPREIPVPEIPTALGIMPGVNELPVRVEMPDVMTMNDGTHVTTMDQWKQRREEMTRTLEYYAVGLAPPPPGNVTGEVTKTQLVLNGRVKYRLVHLTFGPQQSLSLNIGIFTPVEGGPFPAIIMPGGTPPGARNLPRLGQGATQGQNADALLSVGPSTRPANAATRRAGSGRRGFFGPTDPETIAASSPALAHGFALVTFNNSDCGEDTTLRNPDGSWAFRNTRFFPAYPGYDWGLLRCWAWGVSRIVDYLETDSSIDSTKLIVSGVLRTGKSALIAGAFDDRLAMVAPVASSGGGTPAYRFSGAGRGGKEGLSDMMRKYPNWFSPHLHQFWGQADKLPFDEHWFIALCACASSLRSKDSTTRTSTPTASANPGSRPSRRTHYSTRPIALASVGPNAPTAWSRATGTHFSLLPTNSF